MIDLVYPRWSAPAGIGACCTTRSGGVSAGPWADLNLGLHVDDHEADVLNNRARLREQLDLPAEPDWIHQTHGIDVVTLEDEPGRDADAAITREPGRVAVVMIADCLPILLCNRSGTEVAAVHAGWRGLQAGVVGAAVRAMHSPPAELLAWIGPAISQPCFEVGDEVRAAFIGTDPATAIRFSANRPGHWLCDLAGIAEDWLGKLGVAEVSRSDECTYRDAERFYSYRRDGVTGRMASLIWIK